MLIQAFTHYQAAPNTALCWRNPDPHVHGTYEFNFTRNTELVTCRNCRRALAATRQA